MPPRRYEDLNHRRHEYIYMYGKICNWCVAPPPGGPTAAGAAAAQRLVIAEASVAGGGGCGDALQSVVVVATEAGVVGLADPA